MEEIRTDFRWLIEMAEELDNPRIWVDVLRTMSSYFLLFGWREEAAQCLSYMTTLFDASPDVSRFTHQCIVLRLMQWAKLEKLDLAWLSEIFWQVWCPNPQIYFKNRFELDFSELDTARAKWLNTKEPLRFATRCANLRYFHEVLV